LIVQAINRKQFLQGNASSDQDVRPPWSIEESRFTEVCTRCFRCAEACPSHLIVKGSRGFPQMSFLRQGCDYCEACVQACPESALSLTQKNHHTPWNQQAVISEQCFSAKGVVCRSCADVCESRAIDFKLKVGGLSLININAAACDGCGECVHVCPAHAIEIQKSTKKNKLGAVSDAHNPVSEISCGDNL